MQVHHTTWISSSSSSKGGSEAAEGAGKRQRRAMLFKKRKASGPGSFCALSRVLDPWRGNVARLLVVPWGLCYALDTVLHSQQQQHTQNARHAHQEWPGLEREREREKGRRLSRERDEDEQRELERWWGNGGGDDEDRESPSSPKKNEEAHTHTIFKGRVAHTAISTFDISYILILYTVYMHFKTSSVNGFYYFFWFFFRPYTSLWTLHPVNIAILLFAGERILMSGGVEVLLVTRVNKLMHSNISQYFLLKFQKEKFLSLPKN